MINSPINKNSLSNLLNKNIQNEEDMDIDSNESPEVGKYLRPGFYKELKKQGFSHKYDNSIVYNTQVKGQNAKFSQNSKIVSRTNSYSNCVVFVSEPIGINDILQLEFLSEAHGWAGHMRFGITTQDPSTIDSIPPNGMSFYASENFWILSSGKIHNMNKEDDYVLNFEVLKVGDIVGLVINQDNQLNFYKNGEDQGTAVQYLPKGKKFYAVIDVYGSAKSLRVSYLRMETTLEEQCFRKIYKILNQPSDVDSLPLPTRFKSRLQEMF